METFVDPLTPENRCDIEDAGDTTAFAAFAAEGSTGIRIATEPSGPDGTPTLQPDAIDFVKWLKQNHQQLRIDVSTAPKRVLHSADIWIPLVFLARDVGLPVYLNLVSSYVYDKLKGALKNARPQIHLSAEYADASTGAVKRFTFSGDHEALKSAIKKFDLNAFMNGQ